MGRKMETDDDVHVIPLNDYREHIADRNCWCGPLVEEDGVVIHHAMDCQEQYEQGMMLQ